MRNKFSNGRLSYFLTPRIHGNVIAWVKPSSQWETEWEKAETMIKDILRWADDGGRMLDLRNRMARSNTEAARKQANERRTSAEAEQDRLLEQRLNISCISTSQEQVDNDGSNPLSQP